MSHRCTGSVDTPRAFAGPSHCHQGMVKAEQKCLLVQQGRGAAPSAAQAVLYLLHRSARTGRSSEESFREIDGEREKTHYKTPHLII